MEEKITTLQQALDINWHQIADEIKEEEGRLRKHFMKDNEYADQCVTEFLEDNLSSYFWELKDEQVLGFTVNRLARQTIYRKYGLEV